MLLISFGTRPEWIKIKPVVDAIQDKVPFRILFTGQHTSLVAEYLDDTFISQKHSRCPPRGGLKNF